MLRRMYYGMKKHAWWLVPAGGSVISVLWVWVGSVNANIRDGEEFKKVLPDIKEELKQINATQTEIKVDVAEIKGRLKR